MAPAISERPAPTASAGELAVYAGLIAVTVSLPFVDFELFRVAGKSIVLPYVAAFLLVVPLGARPGRFVHALKDPVLPFLLAWVLIACASTALGYERYHREAFLRYTRGDLVSRDLTQLTNLWMMVAQYVLFTCAMRTISPEQLRRVVFVFMAVGVAGAAYTLYQIGSVLYGWPYDELFRNSNLYLRAETLEPGGFGGWIRFPRGLGTAPEPSLWGTYLNVVLGFLLGSALAARRRSRFLVPVLLVLAALFLTFSRGAWLTAAMVVGLWLMMVAFDRIPWWAPAALLVSAVAITLWPNMLVRGSTDVFQDLSALERMSAHLTGLRIVWDNPLFGIGFGSIPFLIEHYAVLLPGYDQIRFITVFSFFLLVLVSTGLVGGAIFSSFLARLLVSIQTAFRLPVADAGVRGLRAGAALACLAVLASWLNQAAYNFSYIWFCFALVSSLPSRIGAATASEERPSRLCASPS
jgi:O-Antigen ligase